VADTNTFDEVLKDAYRRREMPWQPPSSASGKHLLYFPQDAPGGERLFYYPPAVDPTGSSYRIVGSDDEAQAARDVGQRPLIWQGEGEPSTEGLRALLEEPQQQAMTGIRGISDTALNALLGEGGRPITQEMLDALTAVVNMFHKTPQVSTLWDQPNQ
jgi:hypothetical protein